MLIALLRSACHWFLRVTKPRLTEEQWEARTMMSVRWEAKIRDKVIRELEAADPRCGVGPGPTPHGFPVGNNQA